MSTPCMRPSSRPVTAPARLHAMPNGESAPSTSQIQMGTNSALPGHCADRAADHDRGSAFNTPTTNPSLFLGGQRVAHPQVHLDRGQGLLGEGLHHRIVTALGITSEQSDRVLVTLRLDSDVVRLKCRAIL